MAHITINGGSYEVNDGATIACAAAANGVYIPSLCSHPDLPPFADVPLASRVFRGDICYESQPASADEMHALQGCGLCVVQVDGQGQPVRSCHTPVTGGMSIQTEGKTLQELRRTSLMRIMANHPHACLTCGQREGCSLEDCSSNVPTDERCCGQFHDCELRRVAEYVGIKEETPRYVPMRMPIVDGDPLISRNFDLCIDCARCVRVCSQVRGVDALGIVHNGGRLVVGSVAPSLFGSACKFCGACVEVCPTGCLTDKDARTGDRDHWLLPCVHSCPAGVDVPAYIRRIAAGDFAGAAAVVWERLPLANVLGYICFHDCEYECRRTQIDDAIAICALKRFALENADGTLLKNVVKLVDSGKRVAVIGAGPAGLAASFFLRFKGHSVTVFEAEQSAGGMPVLSIPRYRLPQSVLDKDLAVIRGLGVDIKTAHRLATAEEMLHLLHDGFDALLVAVGLPASSRISIEGSDLPGVLWGLEFLKAVKAGETIDVGGDVVIVGGGNVAIDVAMTALRLSQGTVRLYCLEGREEMPAHAAEIEKAETEGVEIHAGWGPAGLRGRGDHVAGAEFRRCKTVFDKQGNFAPTFDEDKRIAIDTDTVILAIGQKPPGDVPREREGVFLAGDIAGGKMSVVHAVASGRVQAQRVDRYLGGDGAMSLRLGDHTPPDAWIGRQEGFAPQPRVPFPCAEPDERRKDFREIEGTYSPEDAIAEAKRCLQCDLRLMIAKPTLPPEKWQTFDHTNVHAVSPVEGVFILADCDRKPIAIKGTSDLHAGLLEKLEASADARFFQWEEDRMYTKRESELIQQHLKQYGELPGGGDDELDDLF